MQQVCRGKRVKIIALCLTFLTVSAIYISLVMQSYELMSTLLKFCLHYENKNVHVSVD